MLIGPSIVEKNTHVAAAPLQFGNPHSRTHLYGWESEEAVEVARQQVSSRGRVGGGDLRAAREREGKQ